MKVLRTFLPAIACSMFFTAPVQAHGDKHATTAKIDYSKAEQMPFGIAADPKKAARTMRIEMADTMRYYPSEVKVKRGETVRFVIRNKGKLLHELVIGTKKELDEHAALMLKFPAMQHDEPYMAHVGAGKRGGLIWTFNRAGEFDFACLIAGHYQAGMVGRISVAAASR